MHVGGRPSRKPGFVGKDGSISYFESMICGMVREYQGNHSDFHRAIGGQ